MLIVWGKKIKRRREDDDTHFCPVCNQIQPIAWVGIWQVPHVYFVSLGRGQRLFSEGQCGGCGVRLASASAISQSGNAGISPAAAEKVFRSACDRTAHADLRRDLALARLVALEYEARYQSQLGHATSITAVVQLFAILSVLPPVATLGLFLSASRPDDRQQAFWWLVLTLLVMVFMIALAVYRTKWVRRGTTSERMMPMILRSLGPLRLTTPELDMSIEEFKKTGGLLSTSISAEQIRNASVQGAPGTNR